MGKEWKNRGKTYTSKGVIKISPNKVEGGKRINIIDKDEGITNSFSWSQKYIDKWLLNAKDIQVSLTEDDIFISKPFSSARLLIHNRML